MLSRGEWPSAVVSIEKKQEILITGYPGLFRAVFSTVDLLVVIYIGKKEKMYICQEADVIKQVNGTVREL